MSGEELGATRLQQPQKGPSNPSNVALIPDSQSKSQKEAIVAKPHDMANPERSLRSNGDLRTTEGFDAQDVVGKRRKGP